LGNGKQVLFDKKKRKKKEQARFNKKEPARGQFPVLCISPLVAAVWL
jgi:hypothetical protein